MLPPLSHSAAHAHAVSIYALAAIVKKRLDIEACLYTILQVLSVTVFEKTSLLQVLCGADFVLW